MNYRDDREQKKRSDERWNLISFLALLVMPPVGVGLFVAKHLGLLPDIGKKVNVSQTMGSGAPQVWKMPAQAPLKKPAKALPSGGGFLTVLGIVLAAIGLIWGISSLGGLLASGFSLLKYLKLALPLCVAAAGGVLAVYGRSRRKKRRRFDAYLKLIGDQQAISIHALADAVGVDYKKTLRDLQEMIFQGILDPAWLDMKRYRLMLTEFQAPEVQPEPEQASETETKEACISRSERILRQIRADNDLIDDEEVSRKIDRIEDLTRKIFEIVDRYPDKEKQLYSFLNYYLPTTLKAMENYARLEAEGIETASIRQAKQKINGMLDELADGYEKQLDKLFENEVVDISADIEVMRQMLQRDGLKEDAITRSASDGGKG